MPAFDTPQAAAAALLDDAAHRDLQRRLDAWQSEEAAVRAVLAEADTANAAQRPPADLMTAESTASAAARRTRDAASTRDAAARRCTELDRLSARAATAVRQLAPLRTEYDRVARLSALTAGTSADNERKMRLESYVLAARLEQVAAAATVRLQRMSSGRYTLVHSDDRTGRGRSGLGLHVVDAWTGRERDTATLSGGETFFASLALALGLADVVTDEAAWRPPRHPLHRRGLRQPRRPDPRRGPRRPRLAPRTRPQRRHRQPRRRPTTTDPCAAGGREGEIGVGAAAARSLTERAAGQW